jgi:hypothetical protein
MAFFHFLLMTWVFSLAWGAGLVVGAAAVAMPLIRRAPAWVRVLSGAAALGAGFAGLLWLRGLGAFAASAGWGLEVGILWGAWHCRCIQLDRPEGPGHRATAQERRPTPRRPEEGGRAADLTGCGGHPSR